MGKRVTLNIAKKYSNGFVGEFEKNKYFQLQKNSTTRTDLYCFAIALCKMENKDPTPIHEVGSVTSFVRTEFLTNCEPLLSSLYYDDVLKDNPDAIDDICNRDEVYGLAENYANTGFGIMESYTETIDEETLFYKLISYMDEEYDKIVEEVKELI